MRSTTINEPNRAAIRLEKRDGGLHINVIGRTTVDLTAGELAQLIEFARDEYVSTAVSPPKARLIRYRIGERADVL